MVSIIIPVYNTAKYLQKCVDSCLSQTYHNLEILLINDGSTDNSAAILYSLAQIDCRIKVIHQHNQGVVIARNNGLSIASGDFFTFLDSDDTLPCNAIESLLNSIIKNDADISIGSLYSVSLNSKFNFRYPLIDKGIYSSVKTLDFILTQDIPWSLCGKLYKKKLFKNLINVPFVLGEDGATLVQTVVKSQRVVVIDEIVYNYFQRSDSAVHRSNHPNISDLYYFRLWVVEYINTYNYSNQKCIDFFLISGYIWCVSQGGLSHLSSSDYIDIRERYNRLSSRFNLIDKIILSSAKYIYINKVLLFSLWTLKKIRFFLT